MSKYKDELNDLISRALADGVSDIHFSVGHYPTFRVSGNLVPLMNTRVFTPEDTMGYITELLSDNFLKTFLTEKEIDFSYDFYGKARFRGNAFFQKNAVSITLRSIPTQIKTISELNLPPILEMFSRKKQGFFLVVGPVGQGKSTTLASMIELMNRERSEHIVTIEDPIEHLFTQNKCIIDQREAGIDTKDFRSGLQAAFRQDVDIIMIGEMRDLETMSTAVTAAETGHLVLSTLHTNNASQTINRIIDSFPGDQQSQIRVQLAGSLLGIFSQRLVPRVSGGLIPAYELLINNTAVSSLIREGRTNEVDIIIETGTKDGMIDMNRCLADLVRKGEVTPENALLYSFNPKGLERILQF
ncbi:MAG: type IV pili twitching motility protein PilT [Candidatus Yonathbacteria bacterium RBG_16_43_6]|uniref:Type IV pili twitching motility protein PilT n=2 Tax=Parcubacteria group TaxID=1794811 RepID=A0A1G2SBQ3_9BACT|nr:MAG: Pilus retraction protein PilT [Candidatus Azambacteria bacterium GW2011_GWA1_44_9]OHA78479.1 MAG: type IV pili twitching motility protein PilT [Candidatus Yonathbacteria bacterium RBG_16_43_6]OHA82457.1 MAG: type IV pili twitching motility protein PilT [Candidatus Yonathbacteria bacterium RIFCSPLOWO2_01_FULL_43_27]